VLEKDFEDILSSNPELIEDGLRLLGRQVSLKGKFADLVFEDRFGQKLVIELKKGIIKREHVAQLLDYEGYFLSPDDPNIRVMLIGNRVPPNLRRSLDHHGIEWKEIRVTTLIEHLRNNRNDDLLKRFSDEEKEPSAYSQIGESQTFGISSKTDDGGLPQLNEAATFEELKEIINIRSEKVPTCYMDKLLLENKNKSISRILKEDWWPYADKIGDRHFPDASKVKYHIKFREERGWEYEYSGNREDPIVCLVGFAKRVHTGKNENRIRVNAPYVGTDEATKGETIDRKYWESRASTESLRLVDKLLELTKNFAPGFYLKYNKHYIGVAKQGATKNFVGFHPRQSSVIMHIKDRGQGAAKKRLDESDLNVLPYDHVHREYVIRLMEKDIAENSDTLKWLMQNAYNAYIG
jgi:hypothetical protein